MARSMSISGFSMGLAFRLEHGGALPALLFFFTAYWIGEVITPMRANQLEDANGNHNPIPVSLMAPSLRNVISSLEARFAFELTGTNTSQPVLAWCRWPRAGTCEYDAARAAHAQTRDWAWRH